MRQYSVILGISNPKLLNKAAGTVPSLVVLANGIITDVALPDLLSPP